MTNLEEKFMVVDTLPVSDRKNIFQKVSFVLFLAILFIPLSLLFNSLIPVCFGVLIGGAIYGFAYYVAKWDVL